MAVLGLIVFRDEEVLAAHTFDLDSVTVGRDGACQVRLDHEKVARVHAVIERSEDGWCLVDLEGSGEVLVHAVQADAEEDGWLVVGDIIEIAGFMLQVATPDEAAAAARELELREQEADERARRADENKRPRCPACGSRTARLVTELRTNLEPIDLALDDPAAFQRLRGELCRECGHLSLFVIDPGAIVPND